MSAGTRNEITRKRVLYETPGMEAVAVRSDVEFRAADGGRLVMDVYLPADSTVAPEPLPAVVIVAGYPDQGFERVLGCRFKDMEASTSWGRLIASSGMVAITYTNRAPVEDLHAVVSHLRGHGSALGVNGDRIGVWASSGNVPLALSLVMKGSRVRAACAALCYGYTFDVGGATGVAAASRTFGFVNPCHDRSVDDLLDDVPLFLVRAGRDEMPALNESLDRFVAEALARDVPLTLVNHAGGPHAFDLYDGSESAREVIRRILAFLRFHLIGAPVGAGV